MNRSTSNDTDPLFKLLKTTPFEQEGSDVRKSAEASIKSTRIMDAKSKIVLRTVLIICFVPLVYIQNWQVFNIVAESLHMNIIKDLQFILSTLIAGTLTETYLIIRIMVEWIFSDTDYNEKKQENEK